MVMACERDAFLLSRGQMVDASWPLVLFHRLLLSPVLHDDEDRRGYWQKVAFIIYTSRYGD